MHLPFCATCSMSTASYAGITNQTEGLMKFTVFQAQIDDNHN